jgi:hypothetical protein
MIFSGGGLMRILALLALTTLFEPANRPDAQASEADLKAAWMYNFAQHVEWPAAAFKDDRAPLVVAILGSHPLEESLAKVVRGKTAQGRPIEIRRAAQPADLKGAHVVFLPDGEKERFDGALGAVRGTPALLVAETEGLAHRGAALNFYMDESKVRFEANVDNAARAGLSIGSKLLKFARLIKD